MTPSELQVIESRANAATPGPWTTDWRGAGDVILANCEGDGVIFAAAGVEPAQESVDAEYAVAACNAFPLLLAELRRLQAERDEWKRIAEWRAMALTLVVIS